MKMKQFPNSIRIGNYTREQQIVATVWYHERLYTGMTRYQLTLNFGIRFQQGNLPSYNTLKMWERKLFKYGRLHRDKAKAKKPRTNLVKYIYLPYVKESFTKFPDLTIRARAEMLGFSYRSVSDIVKEEISPEELELLKNKGRKDHESDGTASKTVEQIDKLDS